uniref:solute carrier family 15 member 1-like n=1 Tax=Scatophagus argus TaxID=75038 RepID=UPI001ED8274C|nr:solute carrier family 15 member 1-like [Scatophagus argus]XP_046238772.1 solute carrier family 15 member 1-like [Scatophagus argus]XP_046238773.1 solute carrier family 15 member 1-like [Scatophagus argus]XP_046238774.1 solute carrier family 15 member 1-like [Scatophagus argus]XP_046238775.1 solute carrier family 15 member 1-like [Scatophagus argus]XP_046238776.1 solute carrier family 15 member 1-like [Scatophagus argus]
MADKNKKSAKNWSVFGFPISIFFIVVNEFCERFSYYGMRAVLVLYLRYFLRWEEDFATTIYHTFVALCYLTPILGAIVADSWLGKFKTIIYLSIVYTVGQVILAVSAIHDITDTNKDGTPDNMAFHVALSMLGLILIALGTGGIKPCVAAFGGDQFQDHQEKQRSTFFSIFYLSINAGSLLSTVITPILKAQECGIHSKQQCYPLAFGVPAALMFVALIVFIAGSGMYTKTAPQGNIMVKVCRCIGFAIMNRFRHRSSQYPKRTHWMDWAEEKYDKRLIAQVKMVLKVLFLYIPLPMFWALFDQQGSRWTFQATTLDGDFGFLIVQAEQMQTVNPILILILVPIMDSMVYPLIAKCKVNFSPLKRMTVGMFLAALAFVAAALVQLEVDKTLPTFPSTTQGQVKFINMVDRTLHITAGPKNMSLEPFTASKEYLTFDDPFELNLGPNASYAASLMEGNRTTMVIIQDGLIPRPLSFYDITSKPEMGANAIRFFNGYGSVLNITVGEESFDEIVPNNMSKYVDVSQGNAEFRIKDETGQECVYTQKLGFGSSYTLIIPTDFMFGENCAQSIRPQMDISPNSVSMALQIPQYFLITAGEVVFSVTGLEFSYSQAPSNMKSVLQAGWLLTVAFGNIIVLIVAEAAKFPDQWAEYILFASLLVLVCIIFAVMAYFYTYIDPAKIEAQFEEEEPEEKEKRRSLGMTRKDSFEHRKQSRKGSSDSSSDEQDRQTKM